MTTETNQPALSPQQVGELATVYRDAAFQFYNAYSDAFEAAIQNGIDSHQAALDGFEAAHRAASESFLTHYNAANADSALAAVYADAANSALDQANSIKNDTRAATEALADYTQKASADVSSIFGNNSFIKFAGKYGGPAGDVLDISVASLFGDSGDVAKAIAGIGLAAIGLYLGKALALWFGFTPLGAAITITLGGLFFGSIPELFSNDDGQDDFWDAVADFFVEGARNIRDEVTDFFQDALSWIPPRDPLTLDLDGDGIETIAADGTVLFDHDGDGIKTATGWIQSDDGILVRDLNNNGTIDNGQELFGDNTIKSDGSTAIDGFDALSDLDSNGDGLVDVRDAAFSELRVWRDLNSDGVSQANELFTLNQLGIESIGTTGTAANTNVGNGNTAIAEGTFTFTNGSSGQTGTAASLNLATNNFYREFPDVLDIPEELNGLPNLQGSGAVRDLKEAA